MAVKVTVRVTGLKEIDAALGELDKRTARAVSRRTLVKALSPMADVAEEKAPFLRGDLKRSITTTTKKPKGGDAGKAAFAEVLRGGGDRSEARAALLAANKGGAFAQAFMGPGRNPQAIMQEFGTVNHPPQPYMRPAFDEEKDATVQRVARTMGEEIDKAVRRIAKRRAKLNGG